MPRGAKSMSSRRGQQSSCLYDSLILCFTFWPPKCRDSVWSPPSLSYWHTATHLKDCPGLGPNTLKLSDIFFTLTNFQM